MGSTGSHIPQELLTIVEAHRTVAKDLWLPNISNFEQWRSNCDCDQMKIALIRRQFDAVGGAELYLQRLLGTLATAGHEIHLFAESWAAVSLQATLHRMPMEGTRSQRPLRFAQSVQAVLAQESFDCVFSLERTLKQDVYRAGDGLHRVWLQQRRRFAPWWKKPFVGCGAFHRNMLALEAQTFNPANTRRIIVNSEMVRREILENFSFPAERIHLVRNGVDVARCRSGNRASTRTRFGVRDDEFLLLFAGSGWERKGLAFVLAALRKLGSPRIKLLVAGKGKRPCCAPANAIFAGPMSNLEDAFAAADLFVFPPIYEPSANVCFEALAAGLPVVTSVCNGAAEIIEPDINGTVLKNPADIGALIEAIRYWQARPTARPVPLKADLSIERNVRETLAVLELAASERAAEVAQ